MRNLIVIILLLVGFTSSAQIAFFKQFSSNGYDYGQGIVQLEDSSYVITGSSSSFGNGPSQAFLLKIDSLGNYLWSNRYGGLESDGGRRVLYKKNFGFFICGYTNSIGNGAYDFYMAKVDEGAQLEWERAYGDFGWEKVNDAALTRDTGAIMVGETSSNVTNNKDIYIIRTDINGDTLWTKTIGGAGDDYATSIQAHNDSMFVIGGTIYVEDSLKTKGYLLYLKDDGSVFWEDTVGSNGMITLNDFVIVNDTVKGLGGAVHPGGIDIDLFEFSYSMVSQSVVNDFAEHKDGDYNGEMITNYGSGTDLYMAYGIHADWSFPVGYDLFYSRFNNDLIWQAPVLSVANPRDDRGGQFIPTSDGGAISVGYTSETGIGGATIFVLKIGPNELYPVTIGVLVYENLVFINEISSNVFVKLFPNPTSTSFTIETDLETAISVKVFNSSGKELITNDAFGSSQIDVSDLASGIYIVQVLSEGDVISTSRMVKH